LRSPNQQLIVIARSATHRDHPISNSLRLLDQQLIVIAGSATHHDRPIGNSS
jgi:hypothetical protein